MFIKVLALQLFGFATDIGVLLQIYRLGIKPRLPWFFYYILAESVTALAEIAALLFWRPAYSFILWSSESVLIVLILFAVRESFLRTLGPLRQLPWFRWLVLRGVWIGVLVYAILVGIYLPPVNATSTGAEYLGIELASRWIIFIYGFIFLFQAKKYDLQDLCPTETAVIFGFILSSSGFLLSVASRSVFGTKFLFITKYAVSAGYLLATSSWILKLGKKPIIDPNNTREERFLKATGMTPEQLATEMANYRQVIEDTLRKN
jgi:hypothetical protein